MLWFCFIWNHLFLIFLLITWIFDNELTAFNMNVSQCCSIEQSVDPESNHTSWCVYCPSVYRRSHVSVNILWIRGWILQGKASKELRDWAAPTVNLKGKVRASVGQRTVIVWLAGWWWQGAETYLSTNKTPSCWRQNDSQPWVPQELSH